MLEIGDKQHLEGHKCALGVKDVILKDIWLERIIYFGSTTVLGFKRYDSPITDKII